MSEEKPELTRCVHCKGWVNRTFANDPLSQHADTRGTKSDPHAPGDWDNVCARCNYGKGLRGGPRA